MDDIDELMKKRNIQYTIVINSWNTLIDELTAYLPLARAAGGTIGHCIGYMIEKQKKLINSIS